MSAMFGVSAITMTSMSFGAYKWFLPVERRAQQGPLYVRAYSIYRAVVLVGLALALVVAAAAGSLLFDTPATVVALSALICAEFLVHEDSRRLLYAGKLIPWASLMLKSNLVFLVVLIGLVLAVKLADLKEVVVMPLAAVAMLCWAVLRSAKYGAINPGGSAARPSISGLRIVKKRILSYGAYTFSSIASRTIQQGDRVLFFALSPNYAWIYGIVAYAAAVPLVLYEMTSLAVFKSRILQNKRERKRSGFQRLSAKDFWIFAGASSAAAVGLLFAHLVNVLKIPELIAWVFLSACIVNLMQAWVMKNSEQVFWASTRVWDYLKIEMSSLFFFGLGSAVILCLIPMPILIKIPAALALAAKLVVSRRYLLRNEV